ncbi:MAG: ImmA/IrrE family metallo-endopeptidase, partial [bacterium]
MTRVDVRPGMLRWARERAGFEPGDLTHRIPQLLAWERGEKQPTFKQLEAFARATHTPFGFLFLPEPPEEHLPIPDLRTLAHRPVRPSPDLLDTIYAMQRRQDWLREERLEAETNALEFVGTARLNDEPTAAGQEMRRTVGLADGWAGDVPSWEEGVSELRRRIESLGIMAVINGVVGNNTHRKLDVEEFRGFALTDRYAPLIFVNGADAKSAQMFTLAHELAHVWLGPEGEGISGFQGIFPG